MKKIGLIVDSTLNFRYESDEVLVKVVDLQVIIDGKSHFESDTNEKIIIKSFKENKSLSTSQPAPAQFEEAYNSFKELGFEDVIVCTLSNKLSGTINSARLGAQEIEGLNIHIIDTLTTEVGSHNVMYKAIESIKEDKSIDDVLVDTKRALKQNKLILVIEDLKSLVKTGRMSKTAATVGNLLKIKPILTTNDSGEVVVENKVRSSKKVISHIIEKVNETADFDYPINLNHIQNIEGRNEIRDGILAKNPKAKIIAYDILSPAVGVHLGLGGLGVGYTLK